MSEAKIAYLLMDTADLWRSPWRCIADQQGNEFDIVPVSH